MKKVNSSTGFDWIDSTLFDSFIEPIKMSKNDEKWIFIDRKIEDILDEMLIIYEKFSSHGNDYTSIPGSHRTIKVSILGEVTINNCSVCHYPKLSSDEYRKIIFEFLEKDNEFREYIARMRLFVDTIV
ncbi:hypothetical protein [Clostridium algidicarnis]|uniref:hypothetical protein n=1 Tax=Clostridium algidicarnis TaxID=37659 RepID=UPI001C0E6190|nr:hypothetical protein [Clostridium algidicarnis]MBU3227801.1 hypothetical protein [Clostridium algidicarnis]MBU3251552.1 hypothetical protein [Clostridium algidicarnis]